MTARALSTPALLGLLALALLAIFPPAGVALAIVALVLAVRGKAPNWLIATLAVVLALSVIYLAGWALWFHTTTTGHGSVSPPTK